MRSFAFSAVGSDRPGIIAAIAHRLVAHGLNVDRLAHGHPARQRAMTPVIEGSADEAALRADMEAAAPALGLTGVSLRAVEAGSSARLDEDAPAASLAAVSEREGVELTLRAAGADVR